MEKTNTGTGTAIFQTGSVTTATQAQEREEAKLYEQIGRLKMELEWVKKKADLFDWGEANPDRTR